MVERDYIMAKRKYDTTVPVSWQYVLKGVELALRFRFGQFHGSYEDRMYDLSFKKVNQEKLEYHSRLAFNRCSDVFHFYEVYSSLRQFLMMKPRSPEQLGVQLAYDYFEEYQKNIAPSSVQPASTADDGTTF